MTTNHHDPGVIARERRNGDWTKLEHQAMDAAFVAAMQAAGFTLTLPSTHPGTRAPLVGYSRDD
jgi:hypothetical protein